MALVAVVMMGQEAILTFEKAEHDFGTIKEADGRVSVVFSFKNEGTGPLILSGVHASCGCTTPTWPKEPVEPGQTGSITVTYNPSGRPGRFQKTITVNSNATQSTIKLYIKGEVIPKPATPLTTPQTYPVTVDGLGLQRVTLNFGTLKKGQNKNIELEYANLSEEAHSVELLVGDAYLTYQVTRDTVQPKETGKFIITLDAKMTKTYGPIDAFAYVVVDGKRVRDKAHKLTMKAEIVEDFSNMSVEEKQKAPVLEMKPVIDFGTVEAGKKGIKQSIPFSNNNVAPLYIRHIHNPNPDILSCAANGTVNGGKKGQITVTLNTFKDGKPMPRGQYSRQITLYTNDPQRAKSVVTVKWNIE